MYWFHCSNCPGFGHWSSFSWLPSPFDLLDLFFFFYLKDVPGCLVYVLPPSWNQPPLQGALVHSSENGIRNQDLGTRSACCSWGVLASRPSQLIEQGNTCVPANLCVHQTVKYTQIYKYFYVQPPVSILRWTWVYTNVHNSNSLSRGSF